MKDGDIIEYNGKTCRIEAGALVPVVKRGPLGGELVFVEDCEIGQEVYIKALIKYAGLSKAKTIEICQPLHCETNIPPHPTFTPMSAGEAAKLPDIVGQWVAVKVLKTGHEVVPLRIGNDWISCEEQILLIEGVDLP